MQLGKQLLWIGVCLLLAHSTAYAQATIAGVVRDTSGAVLPGVTVEAASPALIEKVRTAVTDNAGRYRIEALQPGTYTITFSLSGFATVRHENLAVGGTGVIAVDSELKVGGVQETITVSGEAPVVDVTSTTRQITYDNETLRALPGPRSYSFLLTTVPGLQTNIGNPATGPVFAIFPIHGGRGVESRLTVDGLNISNPPGGNQPPNFTADIGNTSEVTMTTSGGLGEIETAGLTVNLVPKQGGNNLSGLLYVSGYGKSMLADNFDADLQAAGATQPTPVYRVYDVNTAVGGPIVRDRLWYYMSVRAQGSRRNTQNVYYNLNAGNPNAWTYAPDLSRPAFSDRLWENYTPRITWQMNQRNKISFSWDEQPVCRTCTGTTSLTGTPNFIFPTSPEADGTGEFSPQRIQTARWTAPMTSRLLLEAGLGSTYYEWGGKEKADNPRDLIQVTEILQTIVPGVTTPMRYRSHNWLNNRTRGSTWNFAASYVTGSHSVKVGYQGNYWRDDRELNTNSQRLAFTFVGGNPSFLGVPATITQYASPYNVNARAMQTSLYAQDQWTINRLTLQGAIRYDNPWSWFPEQVQPASRFFPGATFEKTDGVTGYHDITPRFGAAYDVFGTGKTALKVNLGKYLQGASVSNLAYSYNPSLRIPGGGGGIFPPSITRSWIDADADFVPDCVLENFAANGECLGASDVRFGSTQLIGAAFDEDLLSGWGIRPSDWAFALSVQQEIFPRASVEVAYHRRSFSMFTTGGQVTDNLLVSPSDVSAYTLTVPTDPRLPGGGGYTVGPIYNLNPNVFGQVSNLFRPTNEVGDDTRVYNGIEVTANVRNAHGFTFSGGTSTGKVKNDWCDIRNAVPESFLLNPYCSVESAWLTSFNGAVSYIIPRIDVQISSTYSDKPNIGTDQIASLAANYTLTAADATAIAAQIGRSPFQTAGNTVTINLLEPGQLYGPRVRQWNFAAKKVVRLGGQRLTLGVDLFNLLNNNVITAFNTTFATTSTGWLAPTSYMDPRVARLNAEFSW
jgi:hypothetical protein